MQSLMLHCGAKHATLEQVEAVPVPAATATHFPLPHMTLRNEIRRQLVDEGPYSVLEEEHALMNHGKQYFGMMRLYRTDEGFDLPANPGATDYDLAIGWRGSYDCMYAASMLLGHNLLICDNLAFSGDVKLSRKNTRFIERDFPGIVSKGIGLIDDMLGVQDQRIEAYQGCELDNTHAHDLIVKALRARVIPGAMVAPIVKEWHYPRHEAFQERNLWSLYNAFTEQFKQRGHVFSTANRTLKLNGVFDPSCGLHVAQPAA